MQWLCFANGKQGNLLRASVMDAYVGEPQVAPSKRETPAVSPTPQPICPYLGLRTDPTVVAQYPTKEHACLCGKRRSSPSLEHQASYCLTPQYGGCSVYVAPSANVRPTPAHGRTHRALNLVGVALISLLLVAGIGWLGLRLRQAEQIGAATSPTPVLSPTPTLMAVVSPAVETPIANVVLLPTPTPSPSGARIAAGTTGQFVTPTPVPGGTVHYIVPKSEDVGWWWSEEGSPRQIGDSFLYAGEYSGQRYIAAVRFDLSRVARGAPIDAATLRLTGLRAEGIGADTPNRWIVQLVAEDALPDFAQADFMAAFTAPSAITLLPALQPGDLAVDRVNELPLDVTARRWLEEQLLAGATSVTVRVLASTGGENALFAWDSGQGSETRGNSPGLLISAGAPPPTPPPLPTRSILVATLTPLPQNVMTAVAQSATTTAEAAAYGTATSIPYEVVTPTSFPANLATVQANAMAQGLPPVVLSTPVPANAATAAADAAYATAVALTTGTFTPVPTGYVTPVLLYPSPPPENVATAAAQVVAATAVAAQGIPAPTAPWNGVYAIYVYATPTPANVETAVAQIQEMNAAAVATGTPTPTPWNLVVITPVPQPTPTEIPIVVAAQNLAPTPTPTATIPVVAQDLAQFRGLILFLSDRSGETETWAMDPNTGEVLFLVRDMRLHSLARELYLANSPDGQEKAIVEGDAARDLQIKIYSSVYQLTRQVTHYEGATSYDPAWSPRGDLIVFVSTVSGGDEIYVTPPDGITDPTRLTFNTWEWDKHPTWSPDGSQIAFYSNRNGRRQIWIMNADGSNQRNLSNDEWEDWDPVWVR